MVKKKIIILSGAGILVAVKSKSYILEPIESYFFNF